MAGVLYSVGGRVLAFSTASALMVVLAVGAYLLAGPEYRGKHIPVHDLQPEPATAVTGHA